MTGKAFVIVLLTAASLGVAAAQQQELRIGVFDSQPVWQQTEEGVRMRTTLETYRDKKQAEFNTREAELNTLKEKLRSQEVSLSDDKKNQMLKEIDQKTIDLKRLGDDVSRDLQSRFSEARDQFQKELFDVVEALGKEKKYTLILEKSIVVYNDSAVDITPEVVAKFNQLFKGGTAATPASREKESKPQTDPKKPGAEPGTKPSGGSH